MRPLKLAWLCVLMLGIALAWWLWPRSQPPGEHATVPEAMTTAPEPSRSRNAGSSPESAIMQTESGQSPHPTTTGPSDYRAQMRESRDYLEFAQELLPAARNGDAAAQFYLSQVLAYCSSLYEWYFIERSSEGRVRHRTLDEAQQISAARPFFSADDIRDIQARCQRLRSLDGAALGDANEWFDAALAQRFPMAQAQAASNLALQSLQRGDEQKARIARDEARRLSFEALNTPDTAVLLVVSGVGAALAGEASGEASRRKLSWTLAAALRDENSADLRDWIRTTCRADTQCQPYETAADVILRRAGNDRDEVERRARELKEKIDAGTLEPDDIG
jgi:hypothetical protein